MLRPQIIASRVVSEELQEQFAALSGDRNPMHMSRIAARRTQAGLPVVHGVHTLLWALETLVESGHIVSALGQIRVKFLKWVYLGDECVLSLPLGEKINPKLLKVEVLGMPVFSAEFVYGESSPIEPDGTLAPSPAAPLGTALDLSFAELDNRSGDAFTAKADDIQRFFPCLTVAIGATAISEIAACSYLVGMEVPGLHSMFSKLDLTLTMRALIDSQRAALHYLVIGHDERFRRARIAVTGRSIAGALEVFIRVPPVEQASMKEVASHVGSSEFVGMNALIVGGSRGLGEAAAKLIAAGGGASTITYALGKVEAEHVAAEICGHGASVQMLRYDVRDPPAPQLVGVDNSFTHLFYFATNTIFRPKKSLVSPPLLADFVAFYLQGFHDICLHLTQAREALFGQGGKLIAYYPSSTFIEERPAGMTEYTMIKAAGEHMCRDMNQYLPNLRIITTRLPRLLTDQTAGVFPGRELDPIRALLPIVREMHKLLDKF